MANIKHKLVIRTQANKIYDAITTQAGLSGWWCKQTTAKPELGFVNVFLFGEHRNEMKTTKLEPGKKVVWACVMAIEEWMSTVVSFDLEAKDDRTILRFTHSGWAAETDMFAACNYDWGRFLASLKSFCENGVGSPA